MNKKILTLLAVLMLSLVPMTASAFDQNDPASYNVNIVVQTASTFSVTVASTPMSFTGVQGATSINAVGQSASTPWAVIANTGAGPRNFSMGINSDPPSGITLKADDANDMAGAITLGIAIQELPGGHLLAAASSLNVWVKADYSISAPIGTYTNNAVIRNYLPILQSITITGSATIMADDTETYTATGKDQENNNIPISPTWSIVSGGGSIDASTGVFIAPSVPGSTIIRATSGSVYQDKTITIT